MIFFCLRRFVNRVPVLMVLPPPFSIFRAPCGGGNKGSGRPPPRRNRSLDRSNDQLDQLVNSLQHQSGLSGSHYALSPRPLNQPQQQQCNSVSATHLNLQLGPLQIPPTSNPFGGADGQCKYISAQ